MASIDEFKAYLDGGAARANQFKVTFTVPGAIFGAVGLDSTTASFLCKTASLPGQTITDIPVNYRGRILYLAGDRTFDPWTTALINDTDFKLRNAFERWMSAINDLESSRGVTNVAAYTADLRVEQLDRDGSVLKLYTFRGAYPQDLSPIDLAYGSNDEIERFQVTFAYQYYESNTTT